MLHGGAVAWDELRWIAAPTAVVPGLILALTWRGTGPAADGAGERDGADGPEAPEAARATETAEPGEAARRE